MKNFYSWYKKHITTAIFIGLILGIFTGLFLAGRFEPVLTVTSLIGSIYMNALNMMIFPLVFCSIIMGISSIGNARTTGKITAGAMIFFLCTTALASLAGLIIPRLIHLGEGVKFEMATSDIQATEMTSILDTIKNLIPSNPVAAFANGNMLQVLVFAVIVGFTLIAIGEKGKALLNVIDSCNEVCLKVISTVMYFTPIGVFCTIVPVVEANGTETIISLATQLIILYIAFFNPTSGQIQTKMSNLKHLLPIENEFFPNRNTNNSQGISEIYPMISSACLEKLILDTNLLLDLKFS